MEILNELLKDKQKTIEAAAFSIVTLEDKLQTKRKALDIISKKLEVHHQASAIGKSDKKAGEKLQQEYFYAAGEINGLLNVINQAKKEALFYANEKINMWKDERLEMTKQGAQEREDLQEEIIETSVRLHVLIWKGSGRNTVDHFDGGFKVHLPAFIQSGPGVIANELRNMKIEEGPHYTSLEADKLRQLVKGSTPQSVLDEALQAERQMKEVA